MCKSQTPRLQPTRCTFLGPHSIVVISLNSIKWLVFAMQTQLLYCEATFNLLTVHKTPFLPRSEYSAPPLQKLTAY